MSIEVHFKKLDPQAVEPRNAYGDDAGWDLFALNDTMIPEGGGVDVRTGLAIALPSGYYGRIVARSSTMRRRGLMVLEGIIDAGFRGELFSYVYSPVLLESLVESRGQMTTSKVVQAGESVAQLIIQKCEPVFWTERRELEASPRGVKGFGSSGN